MSTKKAVAQPETSCKPTAHHFISVEVTVFPQGGGLAQYAQPVRAFKLFCTNCGQVRTL